MTLPAMHHISAGDTVTLGVLAGPGDGIDHCVLAEIWEPGGAQPFNSHPESVETFYFLAGEGEAEVDGRVTPVAAGDHLVLAANTTHRIRNTGRGRLYAITTMLPDHGFAAMVEDGPPAPLDDADRAVLLGVRGAGAHPGVAVRRFGDMSGPESGLAGPGLVALQPIGSVEHHGPHLPLITDSLVAEAVSQAVVGAASDLPLVLLPTLSYALSSEHLWAPGTVSLGPETLLRVLDDVGASLARAGVPRLVFVNGHGGNSALLRIACREIRVRHGLLTFLVHPSLPVDQGGVAVADDERGFAIHGSAGETSMVMHLRPDLVRLDKATRSVPDWLAEYRHVGFGGDATFGWTSEDVMASGVIGDPTLASPERGKVLFDGAVERLTAVMAEIARFEFPKQ